MTQLSTALVWRSKFINRLSRVRQSGVTKSELLPKGHSALEIRSWIVDQCAALKITTTFLAKTAKLAPSTLNRFVSEKAQKNLTASTIEALVEAFANINDAQIFADTDRIRAGQSEYVNSNPYPKSLSIPVLGRFHQGITVDDLFTDIDMEIKLPIKSKYASGFCAFIVVNDEIKDYTAGSMLICRSTPAWIELVSGQSVICIIDENGKLAARLMVVYSPGSGSAWVYPHASDPAGGIPTELGMQGEDYAGGTIVGFEIIGHVAPLAYHPAE